MTTEEIYELASHSLNQNIGLVYKEPWDLKYNDYIVGAIKRKVSESVLENQKIVEISYSALVFKDMLEHLPRTEFLAHDIRKETGCYEGESYPRYITEDIPFCGYDAFAVIHKETKFETQFLCTNTLYNNILKNHASVAFLWFDKKEEAYPMPVIKW